MLTRIINGVRGLFGLAPAGEHGDLRSEAGRPLTQQVFLGEPLAELPEFAQGIDTSALVSACQAHIVCDYTPHIEQQRIYIPGRRNMDGNLDTEYEGISATCPAIKTFGLIIAQEDGLIQAYRYVDVNHILACCCQRPADCPFLEKAVEERDSVDRRMRKYKLSGRA